MARKKGGHPLKLKKRLLALIGRFYKPKWHIDLCSWYTMWVILYTKNHLLATLFLLTWGWHLVHGGGIGFYWLSSLGLGERTRGVGFDRLALLPLFSSLLGHGHFSNISLCFFFSVRLLIPGGSRVLGHGADFRFLGSFVFPLFFIW